VNYAKLSEALKQRIEMMSDAERFRFFAAWYGGLQYMGGHENPIYGADCSGTVCGPLWLMGYNIRCTADDLYRKLFTKPVGDFESRSDILAVFYLTSVAKEHFGRTVPPGYAVHVTPVIGRYVVQNAFDPIEPMSAAYVRGWYEARAHTVEWRGLNHAELVKHSEARDLVFGLDPILEAIRPGREVYGT